MSKKVRKHYRIKYKIAGDSHHHYKYYTALNKETARTMFQSGFRHTHGDDFDGQLDYYEVSVKRYGKWRREVEVN